MASKNTVPDLENDLSPEEEAKRADEYKAYMANEAVKNKAKAAADAAKAAERDPAIATLLRQLGGDNPTTRAISAALYDQYGLSDMADLGRSDPYTYNDPGEYVQTSTGDSGNDGYWARDPGERQVTDYINKKTGQKIGNAPETLGLGSRYVQDQGTFSYYLDKDGKIQQAFTPGKKSHGLWDQGLGNLISVLNVIPGANLFTLPITAGRAALNGDWGQVAMSLAPTALDYLASSTDLLSNLAGPDFNPTASTASGMLAEAAGLGLQGLPADMLGNAVLGAAKSGLTGGDVGTGALVGGASPLIAQGVKSLTSGLKDGASAITGGIKDFASDVLKGDAGDDLLTGGTGADQLTYNPGVISATPLYDSLGYDWETDPTAITYDRDGNPVFPADPNTPILVTTSDNPFGELAQGPLTGASALDLDVPVNENELRLGDLGTSALDLDIPVNTADTNNIAAKTTNNTVDPAANTTNNTVDPAANTTAAKIGDTTDPKTLGGITYYLQEDGSVQFYNPDGTIGFMSDREFTNLNRTEEDGLDRVEVSGVVDPIVDINPPPDTLGSDLTDPFVNSGPPADTGDYVSGDTGETLDRVLSDTDTTVGGAVIDTVTGGTGNDTVTSSTGNDTVTSSTGNDTVTGGATTSGNGSNIVDKILTGVVTGAVTKALTDDKKTATTGGTTSPDTVTLLTSAGPAVSSVASVGGTTSPDTVTLLGKGLQDLPTATGAKRYWRQTGETGNNGQGGVRFFDWYDTPENRTVTPPPPPPPPPPPAPVVTAPAPTAKQYFNQATNRYYTDPTGTWQPPAGWTQTRLKDGGEVKTKHFDGGGSIKHFDFDTGVDFAANDDYLNLFDMPGSVNFDTQLASANEALDNYTTNYLKGLPSDNASYGDVDRTASYQQDIKNAANASGSGFSGGSAIDKLLKLAKDNPNATKALLAAGLGGLLGYVGRPKPIAPKGMQAGSLGLTQSQVYNALKGIPVQRAGGGEIDGYAAGGGLHYLKSAEDGMADRIPATIDNKQPAKLSGGEFVIPADVVSHLGNGNSEAGAKQLYAMMDRIRHARTGTKKQGKQVNPAKFTPK